MPKPTLLIFLFALLGFTQLFAQSPCTKIFDMFELEREANYASNTNEFHQLFQVDIVNRLGKLGEATGIYISSFKTRLLIDTSGRVQEVETLTELPDPAREDIEAMILKSDFWTPAQAKGKPVCSWFTVYIGCIRWQK